MTQPRRKRIDPAVGGSYNFWKRVRLILAWARGQRAGAALRLE